MYSVCTEYVMMMLMMTVTMMLYRAGGMLMLCGYSSGAFWLAVTYICTDTYSTYVYILVSVFHLYGYSHVTPYPQAQQATENLDAQSHRLLLKSEEAIK